MSQTNHLPSMPLSPRASQLSEELLQRRRQEEKEAQDLESMVHSVEQNLHLMTVHTNAQTQCLHEHVCLCVKILYVCPC